MTKIFVIVYITCRLVYATPEPRWTCRIVPVIVTQPAVDKDRPAMVMYGAGEYGG